jgi:hypothetical protein
MQTNQPISVYYESSSTIIYSICVNFQLTFIIKTVRFNEVKPICLSKSHISDNGVKGEDYNVVVSKHYNAHIYSEDLNAGSWVGNYFYNRIGAHFDVTVA